MTISQSTSTEAKFVQGALEQTNDALREAEVFGYKPGIYQKLIDVYVECSTPKWDGEQADPVIQDTLRNSWIFLDSLPLGVPYPDISAEPDGAIVFEWYSSANKVLSLSIDADGNIDYAGLFGVNRRNGADFIGGDISEDITSLIAQVYQQ